MNVETLGNAEGQIFSWTLKHSGNEGCSTYSKTTRREAGRQETLKGA